jgi:hypothetical protein
MGSAQQNCCEMTELLEEISRESYLNFFHWAISGTRTTDSKELCLFTAKFTYKRLDLAAGYSHG